MINIKLKSSWKQDLKESFSNPIDLCRYLKLDENSFCKLSRKDFAMRVPRSFAKKMKKNDINDPLLKQVLPVADEQIKNIDFLQDPVFELKHSNNGIIHKYKNRILVIFKTNCVINCRYCFRRHYPYVDNSINKSNIKNLVNYLNSNKDINEVILSGGDPLFAEDKEIRDILLSINQISHVKTIRFHTRVPVVMPSRVDDNLLEVLKICKKNLVFVLHINHINELCDDIYSVCLKLKKLKAVILNQGVLLKGISDCKFMQVKLQNKLFDFGIMPYYLHVLDKVQGSLHFYLSKRAICDIVFYMRANLSGYLMPKCVIEKEDSTHKEFFI